jgi:sugar-specific transcriptional regulator TrmB
MKSEIELEQAILDILNKIRSEFPELIKYVNEMPLSVSRTNSESVSTKELEAYLNSLHEVYSAYSKTHS